MCTKPPLMMWVSDDGDSEGRGGICDNISLYLSKLVLQITHPHYLANLQLQNIMELYKVKDHRGENLCKGTPTLHGCCAHQI